MNAHTIPTARPRETEEQARALAAALLAYADRLAKGFTGDRALHAVCVAAENFTDDGDFYALRDALQCERGWDDDGFALPDQGEPYRIGGLAHWERGQ